MGVFSKKNQTLYTPKQVTVQTESLSEAKTSSKLGKTLSLKGELHANEEVLIEGVLEGTVQSDGTVIIGKTGRVTAEICAREVIIKGEVTGNVTGKEKVEIVPFGVLNGNIVSKRVVLAEGAIFKGNIDMSVNDSAKKALPESKVQNERQKHQPSNSNKQG